MYNNDLENNKDYYYALYKIKNIKKYSPFESNEIKENKYSYYNNNKINSIAKNKFKFNSLDINNQNFQRKDNINKEISGVNNNNTLNKVYKPIINQNKNIENEYRSISKKTNNHVKGKSNIQNIKEDNIIINNNLYLNDEKSNNILYSTYNNIHPVFNDINCKKPNNLYQKDLNKNEFYTPKKINMQNNSSFNNKSYQKNCMKYTKNNNLSNNDINKNITLKNYNNININLNINLKKNINFNTFSENKIQLNKKGVIIDDKKDDQTEEIKLSKIADDLYNIYLEQKNKKSSKLSNKFSNNNLGQIPLKNNDKNEFFNNNNFKFHLNNKNREIIEKNFQVKAKNITKFINNFSLINKNNKNPRIKDFHSDIQSKFSNKKEFHSFRNKKNIINIPQDEMNDSNDILINIINDKKENVDKIDVLNDLENINSVGYEIVNKKDSKDNIEDNEILDEKYEQDIIEFDYDKEFKEDLKSLNDEDIFDSNLFFHQDTYIRPFNLNGVNTNEILELNENVEKGQLTEESLRGEVDIISLSISSENFYHFNNIDNNNEVDINELSSSSFSSLYNNNAINASKKSTDYSTNASKNNSINDL